MLHRLASALILMLALCSPSPLKAQTDIAAGTGILTFNLKPITSEVKLKKKIQKQLESGGPAWGIADRRMVFPLGNKRFINFDLPNFTHYGSVVTRALPAGDYVITCAGFAPTNTFSVEKALEKGAYINEDVLSFRIEPGKETTLNMLPIIRKDSTLFVKYFLPELVTSVNQQLPPVSINVRGEGSIAWPDYRGDLKFKSE